MREIALFLQHSIDRVLASRQHLASSRLHLSISTIGNRIKLILTARWSLFTGISSVRVAYEEREAACHIECDLIGTVEAYFSQRNNTRFGRARQHITETGICLRH